MAEHLVGGALGLPVPSSGAAVIARQQQRQNTFFAKLKEPGAADVARDVNAFLKQFVARWPTLAGMQQQAECIHSFISATHERLVTSHPLWKGCTAEEATDILEGLERLITIKLYKLFAFVSSPGAVSSSALDAILTAPYFCPLDDLLSPTTGSFHQQCCLLWQQRARNHRSWSRTKSLHARLTACGSWTRHTSMSTPASLHPHPPTHPCAPLHAFAFVWGG